VSYDTNMLIWCSRNNFFYYYQYWKRLFCLLLWNPFSGLFD